jgi:hypothetical protein
MNRDKFIIEKILVCIVFISLLAACVTTRAYQTIEINKNNVKTDDVFNLTDYVDSCCFATLESTQNSLIGEIKDMQFADNKIFIFNSVLGNSEILVFDRTGHFLNKIGTKGNGPHEYLSINSFCINSFKSYIVVFDSNKQKIIKYNYSGKFLESLPIKNECGLIIKSHFISKDRMLCVNGVNSRTSTVVFECDENLGNIDVLSTSGLKCDGLYIYAKNPIAAGSKYYINPLSNIVYKYVDKESIPAFKIDLNVKQYNPETEVVTGDDYGKSFIASLQKGFFPLSGVFESDKYLLFIQNGYFTLWNKKDNTGISSACTLSDGTPDILPLSACSVVNGDSNEFMSVLSNNDFVEIKKIYNVRHITPNIKISKLLNEHNAEDNPTVVFYQLK